MKEGYKKEMETSEEGKMEGERNGMKNERLEEMEDSTKARMDKGMTASIQRRREGKEGGL